MQYPNIQRNKKKYPYAALSVMINPITKDLLEYNPYVDKIISIKDIDYKGLSGKIKLSYLILKEKYDIAVCLNPNVPFATTVFWGLIPIRLSVMPDFSGITFKLASVCFTSTEKHIAGRLVIETYMEMLKAIGIESKNILREVYKSDNADTKAQQLLRDVNKPIIGIAVSSGNKLKELGVGKIVEIVDALIHTFKAYIIIIGSDTDRHLAQQIISLSKDKSKVTDLTGVFTLSELPALIEKLSLFIGVDSGITYMADSLLIPLINIAGPADMDDQRPLSKNSIIIQEEIPCVPCSHTFRAPYYCTIGDRPCITSVEISRVVQATGQLLMLSQKTKHDK